jgi:myo-inositol-1(or 4)-monophosphatase
MTLLNLAARVCNTFTISSSQHSRTVQKVKENQYRDVVTNLDMTLHHVSEQFVNERLPGCKLISEEGDHAEISSEVLRDGEWLIVDPLDGSNNHVMGMPNYGYMAAHLSHGSLAGAVVVLPEENQYIVIQDQRILFAQPLPLRENGEFGTVYYAYPPNQGTPARQARNALIDLIDSNSAGMYRYGSACAGLYQVLCGRHVAFIGHQIRLWDAIAFLPILKSANINVMYYIKEW